MDLTVRCHRSEFRFLPTKERTNILGFWLAKAQKRFPGVRVLAVCAMSNHAHLILEDREAQLSDFAQYFLGHAAKRLNHLDQVHGAVFERRFAEIVILDREALINRIAYAICNPVEANLVRSHRDWTGLCSFSRVEPAIHRFALLHERRFREALAVAERTGERVDRDDFLESAELEIAGVDEQLAAEIDSAIEQREADLRSGQPGILGMQRILQGSPFDRPDMTERSKMPLCFASTREVYRAFVDTWTDFVAAFREASAAFRSGVLTTPFPIFSFRPITSTA